MITTDTPRPSSLPKRSPRFLETLQKSGVGTMIRGPVKTLQVNVGKLCNMACHHCHVDAGPKRTEIMPEAVAARIVELLKRNTGVDVLDLTGGAPELNPNFRRLVTAARRMDRRIIDRCNLTVLFEPGQSDLADFLAAEQVEVVASLPCYLSENVERQRGRGAFDKSIQALKALNALGYGIPGSPLKLNLVYNPTGPFLPPDQAKLEANYRAELSKHFGLQFHSLLTITNMPIKRYAHALARDIALEAYMGLLVNHFNPATVPGLMCKSLLSVSWDGRLFDCDFNQMLDLPLGAGPRTVFDCDSFAEFEQKPITTASHCYGCTAGAGSSCSGALSSPVADLGVS